jgi:phage gp46-like protein
MSEIRVINVTNLKGIWADWLLLPTDMLDEKEELVNIAKVALLTDALADTDDILPDPDATDRRGWWGDMDAESIWAGWPIGCKCWLLSRAKITPAEAREGSTLARAATYCMVALQPMIDQRICSHIDVVATRASIERINVSVKIYRGPLQLIELQFQNLWFNIEAT